jgi:hypothetical protein
MTKLANKKLESPNVLPEEEIQVTILKNAVVDYINYLKNNEVKNQTQYYQIKIFETALATFYGNEIFEWINRILK